MKTVSVLLTAAAAALALALEPSAARPSTPVQDEGLAPGGAAAFDALEMLRLRDGRVLWAQITDHTPDRFDVRRLDTLGTATLPWSYLDPAQELELKRRYGYVEVEVEELTVEASILPLVDGTELIGVIEQATPDAFHVKTETGLLVLPRERVGGAVTPTRVPARDVYSRQELYERRRAELLVDLLGTGQGAIDAHLELARHCERILDYVNAVVHYRAALALGTTDESVEGLLEIAERRAEAQSQVDALDAIDKLRRQGNFPEAVRELDAFAQAWPQSPLMDDWVALNQRVLADRERDALRIARDRWFYWLSKAVRDAAKELDFEQAQAFAEEQLGQLVLQEVTKDVQKIWPEASTGDVRDLFARRTGVRVRGATYGLGTFLLGKERATAVPDEEEEEATTSPLSGLDQQRRELQERMERFLEGRRSSQGGALGESQIDPQQYWVEQMTVSARAQWLTAYYAEFGGDLEMLRPTVEPHADCGGTGYVEVIGTNAGGGVSRRLVPDPNCGGVGVKRRVKYQ